jgi:hypothetical protein
MAPRGSVVAVVAGAASGTKHIWGLDRQPLARARRLRSLAVRARKRVGFKGSRPRNFTVPPVGRAKRRADLGERAGGVVAPVRGSPS